MLAGQAISWKFINKSYEQNLGNSNHVGVALCYKLTLDHIYLISFSKMRVDLAAQVNKHNKSVVM